jgi:hypothetical protein
MILQIAVKTINNLAGLDGIVLTLLVFGLYLGITDIDCDEPGFSLRPARLTSREAWRSAIYKLASSLYSFAPQLFFNIPRCISKL